MKTWHLKAEPAAPAPVVTPATQDELIAAIRASFPGACVYPVGTVPMLDLDETQTAAIIASGDDAGAYLDSIRKTDLATMTQDQWHTLLEVIVRSYFDNHIRISAAAPPAPVYSTDADARAIADEMDGE